MTSLDRNLLIGLDYHTSNIMIVNDNEASSKNIGSNETAIMVEEHADMDDSEMIAQHLATGTGEEPSFNLKLIEAVKQSHCLYDASDKQYRSADYKIKVWNRLVQVLGFQGDARTLYNRWKQLRDKYGKEKKKIKYSGEQQSQWQYFKYLTWLNPHMLDRTQLRYERNRDGKNEQQQIVINDPNFTLHLINEVRLQPCLYDIKDPKYRHTEYRNHAWSEIVKNLAFPGDVIALYKQWKKVRDRYVREKRKLRMTSNAGHEEPNWELYRELIWIDPYLDERAAQVKRKRESSELSGDESMFMSDTFSSTLNSSGLDSLSLNNTMGSSSQQQQQNSQHHHQQMQQQQTHYEMLQQQQNGGASINAEGQVIIGNQLQQLVKLQNQQHNANVQLQSQNLGRIRSSTSEGTTIIGTAGGIGLATSATGNTATAALMMPQQQHNNNIPLQTSQIHHQLIQQGAPTSTTTQHVIITNEPPAVTIDGDRAFAISVAADLLCLPEHARTMARAQIQHLLENSKITIVKA